VSIWNLCDLLVRLVTHPSAPGHTWMVCDGEDLSTPELIRRIAVAMNRPSRLLPIPVSLVRIAGALAGRRAEVARLCGSLVVDATATRNELGWSAPMNVDDALARTVEWYVSRNRPP
jgi:UDP-N-acetyl-alpha-D-quinovosamine dehydrogenase